MVFGWMQYIQTRNLPVHSSMGRLEHHLGDLQDLPHAAGEIPRRALAPDRGLHDYYFGSLEASPRATSSSSWLSSILGILGSYGVAWFGIRINTVANSRTAFSALKGNRWPRSSSRCARA
jgi:K(+)-stimulated pyrophosphate-energized sodium pump